MTPKPRTAWRRPDLKPWAHSCREWTIEGFCDLGVQTFVDPEPLSITGEALAVLSDRRVLEVVRDGGTWQLTSRDPANSVARLEGRLTDGPLVLAAHVCGQPLPADWPAALMWDLLSPRPPAAVSEEPPF